MRWGGLPYMPGLVDDLLRQVRADYGTTTERQVRLAISAVRESHKQAPRNGGYWTVDGIHELRPRLDPHRPFEQAPALVRPILRWRHLPQAMKAPAPRLRFDV